MESASTEPNLERPETAHRPYVKIFAASAAQFILLGKRFTAAENCAFWP
jgi:hypothetical protein